MTTIKVGIMLRWGQIQSRGVMSGKIHCRKMLINGTAKRLGWFGQTNISGWYGIGHHHYRGCFVLQRICEKTKLEQVVNAAKRGVARPATYSLLEGLGR